MIRIITFLLVFFLNSFSQAETSGTFTVVKGDVQVTSANGTTEKAKIGKKVLPADIITAGADSRAKIVMTDKNVINISPETKMALEKYVFDPSSDNKQVTLNVVYGKVRATVEQKYDGEKNKFHIKTPAAVAGVRGTDFLTSYSPKTKMTKIITFEGKVAVGLPGPQGQIMNPIFVAPGQMSTTSQGAPPAPPVSVPKEELKTAARESQAEPVKQEGTRSDASGNSKEEKPDDKTEEAKSEEQRSDDSKKDDTNKEDAKKEELKKEDTKKEDSKKDESKKDEAKTDSSKPKEELKTAEEKNQAQSSTAEDSKQSDAGTSPKDNAQKSEPANTAAKSEPGPTTADGSKESGNKNRAPASQPSTEVGVRGTSMLDASDLRPVNLPATLQPSMNPTITNYTPLTNTAAQQPTVATQPGFSQMIQNAASTRSTVNITIQRAPATNTAQGR